MNKRPSNRPEHCPQGYEWLPDVYAREIAPHGQEGMEKARQLLAEGQVKALLRMPVGQRFEIPLRMWDKEPRAGKVYPKFQEGWMRMRLQPYVGPYAEGWIFVPESAFSDICNCGREKNQHQRPEREITPAQTDDISIRINQVIASAKTRWPKGKKLPSYDIMAEELESLDGNKKQHKHNYRRGAIKKILMGTYPAMKRRDITSPYNSTHP